MSVEWGRRQERLTAVFFPMDTFPTTTLPGSAGTGDVQLNVQLWNFLG